MCVRERKREREGEKRDKRERERERERERDAIMTEVVLDVPQCVHRYVYMYLFV